MSSNCPACGRVDAGVITYLEGKLPPALFEAVASRLQELEYEHQARSGSGNAHLEIHLHVVKGDPQETRFDPDTAFRKKIA